MKETRLELANLLEEALTNAMVESFKVAHRERDLDMRVAFTVVVGKQADGKLWFALDRDGEL